MYIKSPLSGAEFSNLYYFRIFPQLYSDMSNLNKKTFLTYTSADKDTDSIIDSKQSDPYWTLTFASNDSRGDIPTLTNVHLIGI